MFKMINQFGNKFECEFDEVQRYLDFYAIFEDEKEQAKYEKAKNGDFIEVEATPVKVEPKK